LIWLFLLVPWTYVSQATTELAQTTHFYPTLAEAWMEAADVLLGEPIHTIAKKRGLGAGV